MRHLPGSDLNDVDVLATALLIEKKYWENFKYAVASGIAMAFNGE